MRNWRLASCFLPDSNPSQIVVIPAELPLSNDHRYALAELPWVGVRRRRLVLVFGGESASRGSSLGLASCWRWRGLEELWLDGLGEARGRGRR